MTKVHFKKSGESEDTKKQHERKWNRESSPKEWHKEKPRDIKPDKVPRIRRISGHH